jgi:hypothetical protein
VASLLSDLRAAWAAIGAKAAAPAQSVAGTPAAAYGEPAAGRRLAMTA